jgi:hypothetical protein
MADDGLFVKWLKMQEFMFMFMSGNFNGMCGSKASLTLLRSTNVGTGPEEKPLFCGFCLGLTCRDIWKFKNIIMGDEIGGLRL